jgi:hypothetical protein
MSIFPVAMGIVITVTRAVLGKHRAVNSGVRWTAMLGDNLSTGFGYYWLSLSEAISFFLFTFWLIKRK